MLVVTPRLYNSFFLTIQITAPEQSAPEPLQFFFSVSSENCCARTVELKTRDLPVPKLLPMPMPMLIPIYFCLPLPMPMPNRCRFSKIGRCRCISIASCNIPKILPMLMPILIDLCLPIPMPILRKWPILADADKSAYPYLE